MLLLDVWLLDEVAAAALVSSDMPLFVLISELDDIDVVVAVSAVAFCAAWFSSLGAGSGELKMLLMLSQNPALACKLVVQIMAMQKAFFIGFLFFEEWCTDLSVA